MRRLAMLFTVFVLLLNTSLAQNSKGQLESDRFWENASQGFESLSSSRVIQAAQSISKLDIPQDSLHSEWSSLVNNAFDPDVHRIVLIADKRKIIHRKYNEKWVNESSRPVSFSMAKSLVSLTVGHALCSGAIRSLDEAAGIYSRRFRDTSWGQAKVRHLLAMSSGSNRPVFSSTGSPTAQVQAETLAKSYEGKITVDLIDLMRRADEHDSPSGVNGLYNNLDTQALAFLVEDATGKSFLDYFEQTVWAAAGAAHPARWFHNSRSQVLAFSGFTAHPYDWLRIANYVLEERVKNSCFGQYIRDATSRQSDLILPNGKVAYGYQIYPGCGGTDAFCFLGHGGQRLVMSPSTGLVMYVHGTSLAAGQPLMSLYKNLMQGIR